MSKGKANPVYKIDDLIDAKNKALFEDVNEKAPIQLVPSTNGQWGGVLNADGKAFVGGAWCHSATNGAAGQRKAAGRAP
jgi:hypothetical protein